MNDKFEHKSEEYTAAAKRKAGEFTDDPDKEAEGRFDEGKSKGKQAADKASDAAKNVKDGVKDKLRGGTNRDR